MKVVEKPHRDLTHYVTLEMPFPVSQSTPTMLGLLGLVYFVTPAWLTSFTSSNLTHSFSRPKESDFLPAVDSSLSSLGRDIWAPNPRRTDLFKGLRLVFVVIGNGVGTDSKAIADSVPRGGGDRQMVDVEKESGDRSTWDSVLRKRRTILTDRLASGCGLILIGDSDSMQASGVPMDTRRNWDSMVDRAKAYVLSNLLRPPISANTFSSAGMRIIHPSVVLDAILKADVSILECKVQDEKATAQAPFVPSTHLSEPTQLPSSSQLETDLPQRDEPGPAPPRRRLTRRAGSRTPAPEQPSEPPSAPEPIREQSHAPTNVDPVQSPQSEEAAALPNKV